LLLQPPEGAAPVPCSELLLYAADRAQHVETLVRPALAAGHWVLSDRFSGSTAAYQGSGRGFDPGLIATLEGIATGGLRPDLCIWLDLPPALAWTRRRAGGSPEDRLEAEGLAFLERVRQGFAGLAEGPGWRRLAAEGSPEAVQTALQTLLRQALA
jgi:dTMP kinase